jgi:hypothetical protein
MTIKISKKAFKFELGEAVRDVLTGFTGIVATQSRWLTGCNTYGVKPLELKDGVPMDRVYFDEPQLELVKASQFEEAEETSEPDPGGPCKKVPVPNR